MEITKVYEDDNILVVNKPYGLITHPKNAADTQPSLTDWVAQNYPELKNVGESFIASGTPLPRYGIAHRLDKDTSGLIIIAKNQSSFEYFKKLFQTHAIRKHYYALVYGAPKERSDIINAPLGRIGMKRTTQMTGKKMIDGKESVTEYKTVKNFDNPDVKSGPRQNRQRYTLLDVSPQTGRTHQIRVHLKSIGCPIVGDIVYAPKGRSLPAGLNRLFLHAYKLEFLTPDNLPAGQAGKRLVIEIDLPDSLQNVINKLK